MDEFKSIVITAAAGFSLALGTLALLQKKGLVTAAEINEASEKATVGLEAMGLPFGAAQGTRAMIRELMPMFQEWEKNP